MKILIFSWRDIKHPQAGGAEVYLHEQAKYWIQGGCTVHWISSQFRGGANREIVDGLNVYRSGGRYSVYLQAIRRYLDIGRPDVVVDVENGIPFFSPLYTRAPVILVIHHIHTRVWKQELYWPTATIGNLLEHKTMPRLYRDCPIVTVSKSSAAMVRKLFPGKTDIKIIHNAVSADLEPGPKSEQPEIVFIGRLKKYKSIHILLLALSRLSHLNIRLNIIGRGDNELRLKKLAHKLSLSNVNFLGYVGEDAKRELLQRAWMAVNPSSMEGWGITNIEANACGTPVIGSNVPGIRDSILDNRSGLLFEYGNVDELADKIEYLIQNGDERKSMEQESSAWAAQFSWQTSAEKMYEVFESTIAKHGQ